MSKTTRVLVLSFVLVFVFGVRARAETLAEIIAHVEKTSRTMKDMSCDMKMNMDIMGQKMSAEGDMKMLLPDKFMMCLEMKMPGMNMDANFKMVSNGQVMYQEVNAGDRRIVNKVDPKAAGINMDMGGFPGMTGTGMPTMTPSPAQCLAELKKMMDVKLLDDVVLDDGQAAWVIEGKLKPEAFRMMQNRVKGQGGQDLEVFKSQMARIRLYIGKQDKYMNKMEFLPGTGEKAFGSMEFVNLKMNRGLTAADFAYTPPEGVPVNDMTEMMRAQVEAFKPTFSKTEAQPEQKPVGPAGQRPPSTVLKVGVAAPAFTVKTLAGKKIDLVDLRGKTVVIFFWATWHKDSVAQLAEIDGLRKLHSTEGLEIIALSLDEPAMAEKVRKVVKEKGVTLSTAIGNDKIFDAYWISEIPAYVLMDAGGKVLSSESMPPDLSELKKALAALFKKSDAKVAKQ
ncbi:MAG: hypothetical protein AMK75_01770 [Planctomycetes bacterium SM23_65]|nr:MAG: hypothetical protein AMK75_01770 [Planctomycetes bacterium SM23_65]